jgi:hypothetical protein
VAPFLPIRRYVSYGPGFVLVCDDWERRDQSARRERIADVAKLRHGDPYPVEHRLHRHGIALEQGLIGRACRRLRPAASNQHGHSFGRWGTKIKVVLVRSEGCRRREAMAGVQTATSALGNAFTVTWRCRPRLPNDDCKNAGVRFGQAVCPRSKAADVDASTPNHTRISGAARSTSAVPLLQLRRGADGARVS